MITIGLIIRSKVLVLVLLVLEDERVEQLNHMLLVALQLLKLVLC